MELQRKNLVEKGGIQHYKKIVVSESKSWWAFKGDGVKQPISMLWNIEYTAAWPIFVLYIEVRAGKKPEYGYRHIVVGRSNGNRQRMNKHRIHIANCLSVCLCTQGKDVTLH